MVMLSDRIVTGSKNNESIEVKMFLKCIMILSLKIMSRCRKKSNQQNFRNKSSTL